MVPSSKWFPSALAERAAWYQNFATQFSNLASTLGFATDDINMVDADNAAFQWLATTALTVDSYEKATTAYRKLILEGDIGKPPGELPLPPTYSSPPTTDPGVFERLDNLVKRIRVSPNYSDEEGQELGIVPTKSENIAPQDMKPDPSVRAEPGNVVLVDFVRGKASGVDIQTNLDNSGAWTSAGRFTTSPATLHIPANGENLPRSVQVRARYVIKDVPVGQYSDIDTIATIP